MFALSVMMEYKLKILGNTAEEARIWDLILEARDLVSLARQKKQVGRADPLRNTRSCSMLSVTRFLMFRPGRIATNMAQMTS